MNVDSIVMIRESSPPQGISEVRRGRILRMQWPKEGSKRNSLENLETGFSGSQGVLPLGCLPLGGIEGVTLTI
jgi:hypothetical protein